MLIRTDPFRELDRLTQQMLGTAARPAAMPMDAYRDGHTFYSIAADYSTGVLTLAIPVREQAKPRSIQVGSSDDRQSVTAG
jgi:hypothetical protein